MTVPRILVALLLALSTHALAAVEFDLFDFTFSEFNDADRIRERCSAEEGASFWCDLEGVTLTRIPTKGVDLFFTPAGEIVGAYAKQQKGQDIGNYNLDAGQNLIPPEAEMPGAAVLLDGSYLRPTDASASWERLNENEFQGTFAFTAEGLRVEKVMRVSNIEHTVDVELRATRTDGGEPAEAEGSQNLQLAFPGIGNVDDPAIKVGQGTGESGTFSLNPVSQPVPNPSYVSLQNNNRNTAFAIVLRPQGASDGIEALPMPPRQVALQTALPAGSEAGAELRAGAYLGPNELVRYTQEGLTELPGLFRPNLLGRLSLGILWVLNTIHDYVGSWGLSIIVLTLLFRILIWPLISTQTRSMFGMQQLQPKIQELQKKYKDDRQTLTQETMKLYKEYGVNPAGGCLPILAQMPLFIILWRVFVNFEFSEGFLWVPDLGQSDPFFILPILYVGVMFGMSYFSAKGNPQSMRQQIIINLVFAFILFGFPAGVLLYFVVSMGVQVFQYWLIQRKPALVPAAAGAGVGAGAKGTIEVPSGNGADDGAAEPATAALEAEPTARQAAAAKAQAASEGQAKAGAGGAHGKAKAGKSGGKSGGKGKGKSKSAGKRKSRSKSP